MAARAGLRAPGLSVFFADHGLPDRWRGRERFVILHDGFGLGEHFLATWHQWRNDARQCAHLHFIAVAPGFPTQAALARAPAQAAWADLAALLVRVWPPLTDNLHPLAFQGGAVQLLLVPGDLRSRLPELVARVDAFSLGHAGIENAATRWQPRVFNAMARAAAPHATVDVGSDVPSVQNGLMSAGFVITAARAAGVADGRPIATPVTPTAAPCATQLVARFAPNFTPRTAPDRQPVRKDIEPHALIVGGGLAGCAAAWALAEQGWSSHIVERHAIIAGEASGNPGGLFHGIVNAQDGIHARFNRAAALAAAASVRIALADHHVAGRADGLLRLETASTLAEMTKLLARLVLPPTYVRAVDASEASALCGLPLPHPAWFYPGGGWVHPAGLARSFLERAGPRARFSGGLAVDSLRRTGEGWELLDADGDCIASAGTVVLANAGEALRLLGRPAWPVEPVRGQLSLLPMARAGGLPPPPTRPVAGAGYALPEVNGLWLFGATAHRGDMEAQPRLADHRANLEQLARIVPAARSLDGSTLQARVAWRWAANDGLPVIGAVPDAGASTSGGRPPRLDHPRFVPRLPGLFVFTALGSRGITWSALGAQVLASRLAGAPSPVEATLLDALDPARFIARRVRRATSV